MLMSGRRTPLLAAFAFTAALLAGRNAMAQFDGGTTTAVTLAPEDFFIGVQHVQGSNLSDFNVARFFDKARCDCDEPVFIYVTLVASGFAKRPAVLPSSTSENIEFWVGQGCDNITYRTAGACLLLGSTLLSTFLNQANVTIPTTARVLSTYSNPGGTFDDAGVAISTSFPKTGNPTCTLPVAQYTQGIWAIVNNNAGSFNPIVQRNVLIDLTAPPSPDSAGIHVEGGNEALVVSWPKVDSATYMDLQGYQILCNRGGSLQVFDAGSFTPGFQTCPATVAASGTSGVAALDPLFVCSPVLTPSATSYRVKILQNDIIYGVAVVSIDFSGNASTPDIFYGTPIQTKSFYNVYRDGNTGNVGPPANPGLATGGFCALGPGGRERAPALAVFGGLAAIGIAVARRRRRR